MPDDFLTPVNKNCPCSTVPARQAPTRWQARDRDHAALEAELLDVFTEADAWPVAYLRRRNGDTLKGRAR